MDQKILLIAGALALIFMPQALAVVRSTIENIKAKIVKSKPKVKVKEEPQINTAPADWINDLYTIQQVLIINNRSEAADLLGQAMVKIIDAPVTKGGTKR